MTSVMLIVKMVGRMVKYLNSFLLLCQMSYHVLNVCSSHNNNQHKMIRTSHADFHFQSLILRKEEKGFTGAVILRAR